MKHMHHITEVLALTSQGVYGSVVDEHGNGLRDAKVTVFLSSGTSEPIRVSKNSGKFRHMLDEGTHRIVATLEGYGTFKTSIHVSKDNMTELKIELSSGSGVGSVVPMTSSSSSPGKSDHSRGSMTDNVEHYYYPRKKLLELKEKHSRHFDIYRFVFVIKN